MNIRLLSLVSLIALGSASAQTPPPPGAPAPPQPATTDFQGRIDNIINRASAKPSAPPLTKFSLDFPGGTPKELAAAIEKAMSKPLNVVIPVEHATVKLPPLRMNNVDVPQLFAALEAASQKTETYISGTSYRGGGVPISSYHTARVGYGFRTQGQGALTDDAIWYFYVEKPAGPPIMPEKACRFYSLTPYLERGLSVDDITTAITTGWKMLGDAPPGMPTLNFHKETKLLIAVGDPGKLETIDSVLKVLQTTEKKPTPPPPPKPEKKTTSETEN